MIPRCSFFFENPNMAAVLFVQLALVGWAARARFPRLGGALAFASALAVVLTGSRGGLVAFVVGLAVSLAFGRLQWRSVVSRGTLAAAVLTLGGVLALGGLGSRLFAIPHDGSVANRLLIWRAVPRMMAEAPGGWGLGHAGAAFMDWYQPLNRREEYRTLVGSHQTWLVEFGSAGRFLYVFGWLALLTLAFRRAQKAGRPQAAAQWSALAVAASFSSVLEQPVLWAIPFATAVPLVREVRRQPFSLWLVLLAASALPLVTVSLAVGNGERRFSDAGRELRYAPSSGRAAVRWLVPDADVLGAHYPRRLRKAGVEVSVAPSVDRVDAEARELIVCGARAHVPTNLLPHLARVIYLSPRFRPLVCETSRERIVVGEFAPDVPWPAPTGVTVVDGAAEYLEGPLDELTDAQPSASEKGVPGGPRFAVADRAVEGDVTVVNVPWRFENGRIDWLFNPTKGQTFNPEWTWQLNRMFFWRDLALAYEATKDEKYVRAFVRQLEGWLDQTGGVPPETGYNDCGSAWRTIEEGLRLMGSWHEAWRTFRASPVFGEDLRRRFREAALAQARHLLRHRSKGGNWLLMEMNGVYTFATDFPELAESAAMRKESATCLSEALRQQILPDGLQYELSPDYHSVTITCAQQVYETAVKSGFAAELPPDFAPLLERMAEAVLNLTTPSFAQPRFNDCFTMHGDRMVSKIAPLFPARQDLAWLAGCRAEGHPPAGATASRYLPWAGFAVMRSDWGADATYLAFDVGPLGRAHAHQDKLTFTLWKGSEELVFDDGGGHYDNSPERAYAVTGHDHNTLLVDGLAQQRNEPRWATEPIDAEWQTTPTRDRACGVYDQGFGPDERRLATHRREIVFDKKADAFTVTDDVSSADGEEHVYEILFQLDTTNTVVSSDGRRLDARYGREWDLVLEVRAGGRIETVVGRPAPNLSGWFVGRNDLTNHPATTVSVRAPKCRNRRFETVLAPTRSAD